MQTARIFLQFLLIIVALGVLIHFLTGFIAPTSQEATISAYDMTIPRTPPEARKLKNPVPKSPEIIAIGKSIYEGKGNCYVCHGKSGAGDGEGGGMLNPPPRDFTDPRFQHLRSDGELFWATKYGVPATGMFSYIPRHLSEEEGWMVIRYIRTLRREVPAV